jgi:hypothetical protein
VRPRLLRITKPVGHNAPRIMHFADMREAVDPRIPSFQKIHAHPDGIIAKLSCRYRTMGLYRSLVSHLLRHLPPPQCHHLLLVGASYELVLSNSRLKERTLRLWISRF